MKNLFKTANACLNKFLPFIACCCAIQLAAGMILTLSTYEAVGAVGSSAVGMGVISNPHFTVGRFYFPSATLIAGAIASAIASFAWDYKRTAYLGVGRKQSVSAVFVAGIAIAITVSLVGVVSEAINYAILSSSFDFWLSRPLGASGVFSMFFRFLFCTEIIFALFLTTCLIRELWKRTRTAGAAVIIIVISIAAMILLSGYITGSFIDNCFRSIYGGFILLAADAILSVIYFIAMKKGDAIR